MGDFGYLQMPPELEYGPDRPWLRVGYDQMGGTGRVELCAENEDRVVAVFQDHAVMRRLGELLIHAADEARYWQWVSNDGGDVYSELCARWQRGEIERDERWDLLRAAHEEWKAATDA